MQGFRVFLLRVEWFRGVVFCFEFRGLGFRVEGYRGPTRVTAGYLVRRFSSSDPFNEPCKGGLLDSVIKAFVGPLP